MGLPAIRGSRMRGGGGFDLRQAFTRRSELERLRWPDQLDWNLRRLVREGGLEYTAALGPEPDGIVVERRNAALELRFHPAARREIARRVAAVGAMVFVGGGLFGQTLDHFDQGWGSGLLWLLGGFGLAALAGSVVVLPFWLSPSPHRLNLTADRLSFELTNAFILAEQPEFQAVRLDAIEAVTAAGRSVVIETDATTISIPSRSEATAAWLAQLVSVACVDGLATALTHLPPAPTTSNGP